MTEPKYFPSQSYPAEFWIKRAQWLAEQSVLIEQGGPFGAIITRQGKFIAEANNQVTQNHDPTAHAEIQAIRKACQKLQTHNLSGCEIYTSCEPCPMCLSAIYWAHLDHIYHANSRQIAAKYGFDDQYLYHQVCLPVDEQSIPNQPLSFPDSQQAFRYWQQKLTKIPY